jgi:hypothetical protein
MLAASLPQLWALQQLPAQLAQAYPPSCQSAAALMVAAAQVSLLLASQRAQSRWTAPLLAAVLARLNVAAAEGAAGSLWPPCPPPGMRQQPMRELQPPRTAAPAAAQQAQPAAQAAPARPTPC